jgi:5-methylcytosine-specific restriction enzyme subunit McrC
MKQNMNEQTRITLNEWESCEPAEGNLLYRISLDSSKARETAKKLSRSGCIKILNLQEGLSISTTSYVGTISLGNVTITIMPKLQGIPLIKLLRYAYGMHDLNLMDRTRAQTGHEAFQDLIITELLREIRTLLNSGLHRDYLRSEELLANPRGRINIQGIASHNTAATAELPCIHHPRSFDCDANRILFGGLILSSRLTSDAYLRSDCRRLTDLFAGEIHTPELSRELLRKFLWNDNRILQSYIPAAKLISMLLDGIGTVLVEEGNPLEIQGFLFDMNIFFQWLLSRFLHENVRGYTIMDEYSLKDIMAYQLDRNPQRRKAPTPRPDFIVQSRGICKSVLDAKYRDIWNHGLPRNMLYQLAIYSLSRLSSEGATILYPTLSSNASVEQIRIANPLTGNRLATVTIRPVNLLEMSKLLDGNNSVSSQKAREQFAMHMIGF